MTLLNLVKDSISDETKADNKYEQMIDLVKSEGSLSDTEKALITTLLVKIEADEESHDLILKIIRDVLIEGGGHNGDGGH